MSLLDALRQWFDPDGYEAAKTEVAVDRYRPREYTDEERRGAALHELRQRNLEHFLLGVNGDGSYVAGRTSPPYGDAGNGYEVLLRVRRELDRVWATGCYEIDSQLLDRIAAGIAIGPARDRFIRDRENGDFGDGTETSPYYTVAWPVDEESARD